MNIIILGAGQIGFSLAKHLCYKAHDVTLVDQDKARLQQIEEQIDLRIINGFASHPDVLQQADAKNADVMIAVTNHEEVNMIACQIAWSLFSIKTKIARIRSPHYLSHKKLFDRANLPIDILVNPEQLIAEHTPSYPTSRHHTNTTISTSQCLPDERLH